MEGFRISWWGSRIFLIHGMIMKHDGFSMMDLYNGINMNGVNDIGEQPWKNSKVGEHKTCFTYLSRNGQHFSHGMVKYVWVILCHLCPTIATNRKQPFWRFVDGWWWSFPEKTWDGFWWIPSEWDRPGYLHKNNFVHRDIKPENFLMQNNQDNAEIKVTSLSLRNFELDGYEQHVAIIGCYW